MTDVVDEETRLQALGSLHVLDSPPQERFDRIVRLTRRMFDVPTVVVSLIDEDRQFNLAQVGQDVREIPRSQSFCSHTIADVGTTVVPDATKDPRFSENPLVTAQDGIRFYAGQPVTAPNGAPVGALCIVDSKPRTLTPQQLEILQELAVFVEAELARTDELSRAGEVQRSLLPRRVPDLAGYEVAGVCLPATAVGGDFYDWYPARDGHQFVVADVMGKGLGAGIIGASLRSVLRGASRFNDLETAVNRTANSIEPDLVETSTFVTMLAARLDPFTHTLGYVDAGHGIAGVVTADGEARQFDSDGLPLGAPAWEPWRADHVELRPGDTFVALSDGLLDLFDTIEEAREAIRETVVTYGSPQAVVDVIAAYSHDHGATDDVTAVVLRRTPDPSTPHEEQA